MGPNTIDLSTLAAVKNRAEVASTNDDGAIQASITSFSQFLLNYCGVATLNSVAALDEIYDGKGTNRIFLRSTPIISVSAVAMNGAQIPMSGGWNIWGIFVDQSRRSISLRGGVGNFSTFPYPNTYLSPYGYGKGPVFMRGTGNVEVVYSAGYEPVLVSNELQTINAQTVTLNSAPWAGDMGVLYYPSLARLTLVANTPGPGEYAVSNGLYVFNAADDLAQVLVSYTVNQAPYDLEYAVRCAVAINYKRKAWQDLESRGVTSQGASSTTRYRDWEFPPECRSVFDYYKRVAII